MDVKTVRAILGGSSSGELTERSDRKRVDESLLTRLHEDCRGYVQRMHEILTEEHGVSIGYSTLTRLVRAQGLGVAPKPRSERFPDVAGEEMQHDTSLHQVRIGPSKQKVVSSGLYLRYSKMRYVRFYRRFDRFVMKCFIDEALRHWGYCAHTCIIDNSSVIILHGSGSSAVIHPEAVAFADNYGFTWKAHALGHANRKAGKERNFRTMETNFLPGRSFRSLEDLNQQAIHWATVRYARRPQAKTKLVPLELFEAEKGALVRLPEFICPPYRHHTRLIDTYGYCSFDGNYYWVPESVGTRTVTLVEYAHQLSIVERNRELVRYDLAPDGVKNKLFVPDGHSGAPRGVPKNRKLGCEPQKSRLQQLGQPVAAYLELIVSPECTAVHHRPAFVRWLYTLSQQLGAPLFRATLQRALDYRVYDRGALLRIAAQLARNDAGPALSLPQASEQYRTRPAYRDGEFTQENDTSYNQLS